MKSDVLKKRAKADKADALAKAIWNNCLDRRGISGVLYSIDDVTKIEILKDWAGIARHIFKEQS